MDAWKADILGSLHDNYLLLSLARVGSSDGLSLLGLLFLGGLRIKKNRKIISFCAIKTKPPLLLACFYNLRQPTILIRYQKGPTRAVYVGFLRPVGCLRFDPRQAKKCLNSTVSESKLPFHSVSNPLELIVSCRLYLMPTMGVF